MADPLYELKAGFARVRGSEEFSDCTVVCGPYQFNAHKVILSTQSGYFKTAFKTGAFKEGDSGIIQLATAQSDVEGDVDDAFDDPEIVKCMMDYFYRFTYTAKEGSTAPPPMIVHAKVFAISIKYQVNGLRDLATMKFGEAVKSSWNNAAFPETIEIVYKSTTSGVMQLRNIIADTIHENFHKLTYEKEIEAAVSNIPSLAYNLLKRSRKLTETHSCDHKSHKKPAVKLWCFTCKEPKYICNVCSNYYGSSCPTCGRGLSTT